MSRDANDLTIGTSSRSQVGNKRRKDRRYCSEYEEIEAQDIRDAKPWFQTHKMEEDAFVGGCKISEKVNIDGRAIFSRTLVSRSLGKLAKEYVDMRGYQPKNYTSEAYKENENKNRYSDVLCNDKTRVILQNGNYVHANWLPIPNSMQKFICAQGPMDETAEDFWTMVLQEKCQVVIMLCDFLESGTEKCYEYFPTKTGSTIKIGNYVIKTFFQQECDIDSVQWRILEITYGRRKVMLHHFRWPDWLDHLAPTNPGIIIDLMQLAKSKSDVRPILVHCSAGIGRTGTFVGLEYANERLKSNEKLGLSDIMKELRQHRLQSIQSHLQYLYLAVCLLEHFARQNLIERDCSFNNFMSNYITYVQKHAAKHGIQSKSRKKKEKK